MAPPPKEAVAPPDDSDFDGWLALGPEAVAKKYQKPIPWDTCYIFFCKCPYCRKMGIRYAKTIQYNKNDFVATTPDGPHRHQAVVMDENGFVSYDHPLPHYRTIRNKLGRLRNHWKKCNGADFKKPPCDAGNVLSNEAPEPKADPAPKVEQPPTEIETSEPTDAHRKPSKQQRPKDNASQKIQPEQDASQKNEDASEKIKAKEDTSHTIATILGNMDRLEKRINATDDPRMKALYKTVLDREAQRLFRLSE